MSKQPAVVITFLWKSVQPDKRQWKPSNPLLEPVDALVDIPVPLVHEYIANSEAILQAQLGAEKQEKPRLTPKGMRYCVDQLELVMSDVAHSVVEHEFADNEWELPTKSEPTDEVWEDTSTDEKFEDKDEEWE